MESPGPPSPGLPSLPPTSWALLGFLAFDEEVSGYDIKKWADWSIGNFYLSPSYSQIYAELKRLEQDGYATSHVQYDNSVRGRRVYRITTAGREAVSRWADEAPIEPPMLKHGVLLRVWFGHLIKNPARVKEILREHIAHVERMREQVAIDAEGAALEPGWAYTRVAMLWAERYYASERELATQLMNDIDEAEAVLDEAKKNAGGEFPAPKSGRWREVEKWVQAQRIADE